MLIGTGRTNSTEQRKRLILGGAANANGHGGRTRSSVYPKHGWRTNGRSGDSNKQPARLYYPKRTNNSRTDWSDAWKFSPEHGPNRATTNRYVFALVLFLGSVSEVSFS